MLQLRISSGTVKNKKLKTPEITDFRPTQEVVKQAIFAILADKINDAVCLDLFAGSGNLGIEALSRGASWCDFVDSDFNAINTIQTNLLNCGFTDKGEVFKQESAKYAANTDKVYDIVFLDPFYKDTAQVFLIKQIQDLLRPAGLAFFLYGDSLKLDTIIPQTNLEVVTTRRFGATHFSVLRVKI